MLEACRASAASLYQIFFSSSADDRIAAMDLKATLVYVQQSETAIYCDLLPEKIRLAHILPHCTQKMLGHLLHPWTDDLFWSQGHFLKIFYDTEYFFLVRANNGTKRLHKCYSQIKHNAIGTGFASWNPVPTQKEMPPLACACAVIYTKKQRFVFYFFVLRRTHGCSRCSCATCELYTCVFIGMSSQYLSLHAALWPQFTINC